MRLRLLKNLALGILLLAPWMGVRAQSNLTLYSDQLLNGFDDWSWAGRAFDNASPVHGGARSIKVSAANWQALWLHHADLDNSQYEAVSFWVHGGQAGGQLVQVLGVVAGASKAAFPLPALTAGAWRQYTIPLATLGVAGRADFQGFWFQLRAGGTTSPFYLDDVELTAKPAPQSVAITVRPQESTRTVDARHFGVNTAIWDAHFEKPDTLAALREMGALTLRFPGGSASDEYHWQSNRSVGNNFDWATSFAKFSKVATNLGASVFITVNYGTGTAKEAADWVRHANITNRLAIRYWEVGNENYGPWETDTNPNPHDPYTYAMRARDYIAQMKEADPAIKVGVAAAGAEDGYDNGYKGHPATNRRTGTKSNGWTPVVLATLKSLGVTPDFLVYHFYPEFTGNESDALLLRSSENWARDAADLRRQIGDYFGPGGEAIELTCTENNSNAGAQGRQSTSLVNALYLADSLGSLMKTEFNSFLWWDLRNGRDASGKFDETVYGWRTYGDFGLLDGLSGRHPTFYALKLLQFLARPGDVVVPVDSAHVALAAHAVRRTDGTLALLVVNKHPSATIRGDISLGAGGFEATVTERRYGIPQDEAARTGTGSPDLTTRELLLPGPVIGHDFPPYSLTVLSFPPAGPRLTALDWTAGGSAFVFRLDGQAGADYVLETTTNLTGWLPYSTNHLESSSLLMTNTTSTSGPTRYWRARKH